MALNGLLENLGVAFGNIERGGSPRGFDLIDQLLYENMLASGGQTYPPSNIIQTGKHEWKIEVALAGFSENQISVVKEKQNLIIEGKVTDEKKITNGDTYPRYLKRGIAERQFKLSYSLPDFSDVIDASFENGMLSVTISREIPEEEKPRVIDLKRPAALTKK